MNPNQPELPAPVFFRTECEVCGNTFTTTDEDADLCGLCEADEQLQRDMDRDLG